MTRIRRERGLQVSPSTEGSRLAGGKSITTSLELAQARTDYYQQGDMPWSPRPARGPKRPWLAALAAAAVLFCAPLDARQSKAGNHLFGFADLHRIDVSISASEWAVLQTSSPRNGGGTGGIRLPGGRRTADPRRQRIWRLLPVGQSHRARPTASGFTDVGIRYKGNLSFTQSSAAAPLFANFKMKIDLHGTKGDWDGEKTFNLHAGVVDTSKMRDALAYAIFRARRCSGAAHDVRRNVLHRARHLPGRVGGLVHDHRGRQRPLLRARAAAGHRPADEAGRACAAASRRRATAGPTYVTRMRPDRDATPHEQQRVMEFANLISQIRCRAVSEEDRRLPGRRRVPALRRRQRAHREHRQLHLRAGTTTISISIRRMTSSGSSRGIRISRWPAAPT